MTGLWANPPGGPASSEQPDFSRLRRAFAGRSYTPTGAMGEPPEDQFRRAVPQVSSSQVSEAGVVGAPNPIEQSRRYQQEHIIPWTEKIADGFRDGGADLPFDEDGLPTRRVIAREIMVADRPNDPQLKALIDKLKQSPPQDWATLSAKEKASDLSALVEHLLGGMTRDGKTIDEIETAIASDSRLLRDSDLFGEVKLGELMDKSAGVCRHMCLMFKVLADEVGIKTDLVRGRLGNTPEDSGRHIWNIIHTDEGKFIVDTINQRFIPTDHPLAAQYFDINGQPFFSKVVRAVGNRFRL